MVSNFNIGEIVASLRFFSALICTTVVIAAARGFYNRLPAHWFCDYDELPWEMHMPGFRGNQGYMFYGSVGFLLALEFVKIFTAFEEVYKGCNVGYIISQMLYLLVFLIICIVAVIVSLSDIDYMIVPDQFVLGLGMAAMAIVVTDFAVAENVRGEVIELLWGGIIGAGLMVLTGFVGVLSNKGFSAGFGDVKLMAVCGAVVGGKVFLMYIVMALGSGLYFCVKVMAGKVKYGAVQPLAPWICGAMVLCMQ